MNTDHQKSQQFWIFVVHNTQQQDIQLNSGSVFITWYVICSRVSSCGTSVTSDLFNFSVSHLISTMRRCWHDSLQEIRFTELQGTLPCSEKPSRNSYHLSNTSSTIPSPKHPHQLQRPPSLQRNKNQAFSLAVKWRGPKTDHSHPSTVKFKNQWSYSSSHPVCLHSQYWDFIFPLPPTYANFSQEFTSFLVLQRKLFIYYLHLSCAHYMTNLFYLHWSNYVVRSSSKVS